MTPPEPAAARRTMAGPVGLPAPADRARRERSASARPELRVVESPSRRLQRRFRRTRLFELLAMGVLVASLLAVVVGQALLAEGQVGMSDVAAKVNAVQVQQHEEAVRVAELETPSRIVSTAQQQLHMVPAGQVAQLPSVPLSTPLPTATVSGAAAAQ